MLVQYIENLQQTIIDQKTQPNYYEQEIERIIKLERQLIRQAILPPLDDLAREVGMSLTKFRHMFKFVYGKPIYEYFLNARMEKAKELLMQGYSVYQVSTMVGFTKANNFSRIFKKYYGFSPSTLRADALVNNS